MCSKSLIPCRLVEGMQATNTEALACRLCKVLQRGKVMWACI